MSASDLSGRLLAPVIACRGDHCRTAVNRLTPAACAFIADDDVRRLQFEETLETVVAVDDAAVQIIQIRRREPSAVQRNQREGNSGGSTGNTSSTIQSGLMPDFRTLQAL